MYSPYAAMGNAPESMVDPNGELPINMGVTPWVRPTPQMPVGKPKSNAPGSDKETDLANGMMGLEMEARAAFMEQMQEQEENDAFFETMAGRDFIGNGIADAGCDHGVADDPNPEDPGDGNKRRKRKMIRIIRRMIRRIPIKNIILLQETDCQVILSPEKDNTIKEVIDGDG